MQTLNKLAAGLTNTEQMPMLFMGHGSPMNAIEENEFVTGWRDIGKTLPKPNAILCISAHWETKGTFVTAMEKPPTIHDFGGFPRELFDVQYPAPGDPALAGETCQLVKKTAIGLDLQWGLDHGAWSVLKRVYPTANVPIIELSLDYTKAPQYHVELARELASLRDKGVLIVGSGNMVHNLRVLDWEKTESGFDWAVSCNQKIKELIRENDLQSLVNYTSQGREFQLAIPTPEHYLPMLYILGLKADNETVEFFNDKTILGSISMTAFKTNRA